MYLRTHFSNGFSTNEMADLTCVCYKADLPPVHAITHSTPLRQERCKKTEGHLAVLLKFL